MGTQQNSYRLRGLDQDRLMYTFLVRIQMGFYALVLLMGTASRRTHTSRDSYRRKREDCVKIAGGGISHGFVWDVA